MKYILVLIMILFSLPNQLLADKPFTIVVKPTLEEPKSLEKEKKNTADKNMVIVVSSGDMQKAGMGFSLGSSAAKKGIKTTIMIGAKALAFAKSKGKQNLYLAKQMTHRDILKEAIENGAHVELCFMSVEASGLVESDFIDGAEIVNSQALFDTMYIEGTKVLSF